MFSLLDILPVFTDIFNSPLFVVDILNLLSLIVIMTYRNTLGQFSFLKIIGEDMECKRVSSLSCAMALCLSNWSSQLGSKSVCWSPFVCVILTVDRITESGFQGVWCVKTILLDSGIEFNSSSVGTLVLKRIFVPDCSNGMLTCSGQEMERGRSWLKGLSLYIMPLCRN